MFERARKRLVPIGRAHTWLRYPILGVLLLVWGLDAAWDYVRQERLPLVYTKGRAAFHAARQWCLARAHALKADAPEYRRHAPRRAMAASLALVMCLGMLPVSAFAAEWQSTCPHDLGQHEESCGFVEAVAETPCGHSHDELCGYVDAIPEIPCNKACAEVDGNIVHAADCAYTPAVAGAPCGHEHDELCGFVEAVAGSPCTHEHDETCGGLAPKTPPAELPQTLSAPNARTGAGIALTNGDYAVVGR